MIYIGTDTSNINKVFFNNEEYSKVFLGTNEVWSNEEPIFEDYKIFYTSTDGNIITPYNTSAFGATIVSNTYSGNKGCIVFDDTVTSIGDKAFYNCFELTSINIPSGVTSIGDEAFDTCIGLTSITIPSGVTSIGNEAFKLCVYLTSFTIPISVTYIGGDAFLSNGFSAITIPSGVTYLGGGAFMDTRNLTSIIVPDNVKDIEPNLFDLCYSLTSVTIGNSVEYIHYNAFTRCPNLVNLTCYTNIPPNLDNNAFDRLDVNIYVPSTSVEAYKTANVWRERAERIQAIPV